MIEIFGDRDFREQDQEDFTPRFSLTGQTSPGAILAAAIITDVA